MKNPFKTRNKTNKPQVGFIIGGDDDCLCVPGYISLDRNPEIMAACHTIAELIASITIHLMSNTEDGDVRIQNELSRLIDINPAPNMTRKTWIEAILMTMQLYGRGNAVVLPHTWGGYIKSLEPIAAGRVSFETIGYSDYRVLIDGKRYKPDDVLHFAYNPDKTYLWKGQGITVTLQEIADNLRQAEATKKGFLASKWKPSVIVRVDAMTNQLAEQDGRNKILDEFIEMDGQGKPWVVPAEQIDIQTVKPLTLADLAIADTVELDKRTVAAVIGVPPFLLGVGEYDPDAWNNFVRTKIRSIVIGLAQEMTKKLIISPNWYVRFNETSLLDWDLQTLSSVFGELRKQGVVDGNEVRDRIGMSPREGLSELVMLENYIPADKLGDQNKLQGGNSNE